MCKLCDKCGKEKCPTHSSKVDLSKRNKKVAAAFKKKDPEGFRKQRSEAGKKGYEETMKRHGRQVALEAIREHQLANPSGPERYLIGLLDFYCARYERQVIIGDYLCDFVIGKTIAEVDGHRFKASFGEEEPRGIKSEKIEALNNAGYDVLIIEVHPRTKEEDFREQWAKVVQEKLI